MEAGRIWPGGLLLAPDLRRLEHLTPHDWGSMPRKAHTLLLAAAAIPLALVLSRATFALGDSIRPAEDTRPFVPSRSGLPFVNPSPAAGDTGLKAATAGRCGGMAFAVLDYHLKDETPPATSGSDAYVLVRNASSVIDNGARFLSWSLDPSADRWWRGGSVGSLTRERELPRLSAELAVGPVPLGLTRASGLDDLPRNHQVVAYDVAEEAGFATIRIYDPNYPGADDVVLEVALNDSEAPVLQRVGGEAVAAWNGVFVANYSRPLITP